jgi:signal transduction histidine kinase
MPGMDGFEVCRRLRATERGRETPILFLTALGDLETHQRALESGADDFLTKPIQRVELLLRVRSLLRIKRLQNALESSNALISSQRDALLRAQEDKRRLTAMIVHDLKSPLTGVLANAQFLLESAGLEGDRLESLKDVVTSSHTMHRMVMDLLDVARSEDGALIPRRTSVNLTTLLEECSASFRGQSRQSRHELVIDIGGDTSSVEADKDLLRRVFENFLDNAAKYAPSGTAIRIEVRREVEGRLLFRVRDRGPGIPEEYRTKIFQQYTQIDHSAHVRTSRGVGLAFCRLAVEAHGGEIWVQDNVEGGSEFCFWLPVPSREGQPQ